MLEQNFLYGTDFLRELCGSVNILQENFNLKKIPSKNIKNWSKINDIIDLLGNDTTHRIKASPNIVAFVYVMSIC